MHGNCPCRCHDDVIKWKHFPSYWPFVRGIHRSPVNSPHKGQWRGALMFSLICVWINGWVNNDEAGDLRRSQAHYDVIVMEHWFLLNMHRFMLFLCVTIIARRKLCYIFTHNIIKWPGHENDHPMNMIFTLHGNIWNSRPWQIRVAIRWCQNFNLIQLWILKYIYNKKWISIIQ